MLRVAILILTFLGTVMGPLNSRSFASHEPWQQLVRARLYSADALEPQNIKATDELLSLAFEREDVRLVGESADMFGDYVVSKPMWRAKLVRSQILLPVLLERLWLLFPTQAPKCGLRWEAELCSEASANIHRKSPNLLALFKQLSTSKTTGQYLQAVPPGARGKADFVKQAVRSSFDTFLNRRPTADQIRTLALWMHDFDVLFYIQDRAVRRATSASEFLRITDYYYLPPSETYRARVRAFLKSRVRQFKSLNPTSDELIQFQKRTAGASADLSVLSAAFAEAEDAGQFLRAAQPGVQSLKGAALEQARQVLAQNISRFSELEPSVEQANAYRSLMSNARADLELLRYLLPKAPRASDYLKLVRHYGDVKVRRTDSYSEGIRQLMLENIDMFMALNPSVDEINSFREKMMDPTGDLILLRAGIERVRSSRELLLLAVHFGYEPTSSTTLFDFVVTQALTENIERFKSLRPSLAEIGFYRARMANPQGDLQLVDYGLQIAATKGQMLELISRRPMVNTKEFHKSWSEVVKKHFDKFSKLKPTPAEYGSYVIAVTDDQISSELRRRISR